MRYLKSISVGLLITVILVTTVFAQTKEPYKSKDSKTASLNVYETMKLTTKQEVRDLNAKVVITNKSGEKLPYVINHEKKNEYLILPLYGEEDEINIKVNLNPKEYTIENTKETVYLKNQKNLEQLKKSVDRSARGFGIHPYMKFNAVMDDMAVPELQAKSEEAGAAGSDYSKTNAQVSGIDEADIVQTDGKNIYSVSEQEIKIVTTEKGYLKERKSLFLGNHIYPLQLYAEKNKLIVIAAGYNDAVSYSGRDRNMVAVFVYDTTDIDKPKKVRETWQEGFYVSSRKDGAMIRLITESDLYNSIPYVRERFANGKTSETALPLDRIMIFPGYYQRAVVMITSFPSDGQTAAKTLSYVGNAQTLYMSKDTMAVSYTSYRWNPIVLRDEDIKTDTQTKTQEDTLKEKISVEPIEPISSDPFRMETVIKRFSVSGSDIVYSAENKIAGTLINQFALDEHQGVLRVAYTNNSSEETSVDTFDKQMNRLGSLSKLAKGERIYSVRFMGEKLYLVTFKQVDPFFVIDMKEPAQPKVLGYLKIPGYSSYLHPIDKNHILGIGNDVDFDGTFVRNSGVKISMFDVTDVKNPKQISNVVLGKGGSHTPVSHDHKAFLYNPNKKYFGFPVTLSDEIVKNDQNGQWIEQKNVFDGACVYAIDNNFRLKLKANISHSKSNAKQKDYDYRNRIQRLLYIDDIIYTISEAKIVSTDEKTMKTIDSVELNSR